MFDELFDDWRHICFQTGHFADFEQFKVDSSFVEFFCYLLFYSYIIWAGRSYFLDFWQDVWLYKTTQTLSI